MSKRLYQLIAVLTLPLPVVGAYVLGRPFAAALSSLWSNLAGLLGLLGYVLALLLTVLLWAVALLPLRARAGFTPLSGELAQMRAVGLTQAVAEEQAKQAALAASQDPAERARYHGPMALVAVLFALAGAALTWALWEDGYVFALPLGAALISPVLAVYHGARWALARAASR
ncbi:MAG: hypothetical protein R3B40_00835 [Polyangiales bacterium]